MIDFQKIKEQADTILTEKFFTPPVNIFELAVSLGYALRVVSSTHMLQVITNTDAKPVDAIHAEEVLGYLDKVNKIIYINEATNKTLSRKRFTVAHELGHVILEKGNAKNKYRKVFVAHDMYETKDQDEIKANYFAGYVLMPDEKITEWLPYTKYMDSFDEVLELFSEWLTVSPEAMRIRLKTFKMEHPELWSKYHINYLI